MGNSGRTSCFGPGAAQAGWAPETQRTEPEGAEFAGARASCAVDARPSACTREAEVRVDGAIALRLFSRRYSGDGRGSCRAALNRHRLANLRRCACAQPGRLCRSRWPAGLRHQRLRRNHPRPLRVGFEAHGCLTGAGGARVRAQVLVIATSCRPVHRALPRQYACIRQNARRRCGSISGASAQRS